MSHLEDCLICHIWKLYGGYVTYGKHVVTFASYIGHIWKLFRPFLSSKSVLCHIWKIVSYVTFGSYIGNIWKLYRSHLEAIQVTLDLSYFKTVYCVTFGSLSGLSRLEACLVCHIWKLFGGQVTFGSYIGHIWTLFALLHLPKCCQSTFTNDYESVRQ